MTFVVTQACVDVLDKSCIQVCPADCIYVALYGKRFLARMPDAIVSGINHGYNLGSDTFYSGTVAAAREGALRGVPSIAFSLGMGRVETAAIDRHDAHEFQAADNDGALFLTGRRTERRHQNEHRTAGDRHGVHSRTITHARRSEGQAGLKKKGR